MKTDFQNHIIKKIKKLREEQGLNQVDISKLLVISPGQMGNIESLKQPHKYTLKQIYTICRKLSVNILDLFVDDKEQDKSLVLEQFVKAIIKYQDNEI